MKNKNRILINFCSLTLIIFVIGVMCPGYALEPHEALEMLRAKKNFEEHELKRLAEMIRIPGGKFVMGRSGVHENEEPEHTVEVDAFFIDTYEVTQLQYLDVMKSRPSYFSGCPLCPVEKVSHDDAVQYCKRVGKRLPTEAEWEKAARGSSQEDGYWGKNGVDAFAWYGNNSGGRTEPVGQRKPNAYGLYDMAGNVWEWVQDWYDPRYYHQSPVKNPQGPLKGEGRVIRGGGWGHPPEMLDHAVRDHREPHTRYIEVGFRCAKDADDE